MKRTATTHHFHKLRSSGRPFRGAGVRGLIYFTCGILITVILLSGVMLGTISYETVQEYHASMQTVSDIYALNDAVDSWDVALEDYVLNATEMVKQECLSQWARIGGLLSSFHVGAHEPSLLALANIRSVYQHGERGMADMFSAGSSADRVRCYQTLSTQKNGILFLSDQLLQVHVGNNVSEYPQIMERNLYSIATYFLILLFSFGLLITCCLRMVRAIYAPIDLLVQDAGQIAAGNYDSPAVEILSDDEMGYLSQVFNDMKQQVSANFKNMERIIELKELLQQTELKALQAQINPHFLFNVLSVAEEAALCENASQTVEVVENISYMLQYSLKCTKQDTSLPEELRMVQAYLFLQEKRFGDRIRFALTLPEQIPPLLVPGMSVQPVVENAIRHGVEKMLTGGAVQVQVLCCDDCVKITVCDNGCGMEPEMLQAIRRQESVQSPDSSGGIGLVNVARRMEAFFRQPGLFTIESAPGRGTMVTLRYPFTERRPTYVPTAGG